ncbi:MAG: DNA-directed DNA polymerase II small subunit [Candidatus Micrarchaeota archaeon]|nr:DNA-directed DNA polymerase II small subunit [Candidatus Micrarchaeota archaeon]
MKADLKEIYARNIRLTTEAYDFLEKNEISQSAYQQILSYGSPLITKEILEEILAKEEKIPIQPVMVARPPSFKPEAKEHSPDFRVIDRSDITGKSHCTGKLEDFVEHFRNRFDRVSKILRMRPSDRPIVDTKRLKSNGSAPVRLIAMVTEKRTTKKGNILLTVEDKEGSAKVVLPRESEAFKLAGKILNDDIIAFDGRNAEELFICETVTWPEIPFARELKKAESDFAIVYLSDLHFGSKKFMEKEFARFLNWLNGEGESRLLQSLAGKVKYIIISGDVVDGIGIYPEQERELLVKDIYKQYELFDSAMEQIPDYITVFVLPGNHDAVRRAEPQPALPEDLVKSNVVRVGNPCQVEIEGLRHLLYHGNSLDSVIAGMGELSYEHPEEAMLELLRRRHLSPIYGDNLIVPEAHDYLVIEEEPDIIHMGHVHKNGYMVYRGTLLVNSGTFQERTDYQVRIGHQPTPAIVPVLEAKEGKLSHINFKGEAGEGTS